MTKEENLLFGIDKLNIKCPSILAATHVDYSTRIQTIHKETNLKYYALIAKFIGNFILKKDLQNKSLLCDYRNNFPLD